MTVILKPVGPGNWATMVLTYQGPQLKPLLDVRVGSEIDFGGRRWRVCQVLDGAKT